MLTNPLLSFPNKLNLLSSLNTSPHFSLDHERYSVTKYHWLLIWDIRFMGLWRIIFVLRGLPVLGQFETDPQITNLFTILDVIPLLICKISEIWLYGIASFLKSTICFRFPKLCLGKKLSIYGLFIFFIKPK